MTYKETLEAIIARPIAQPSPHEVFREYCIDVMFLAGAFSCVLFASLLLKSVFNKD